MGIESLLVNGVAESIPAHLYILQAAQNQQMQPVTCKLVPIAAVFFFTLKEVDIFYAIAAN